MTAKQWPINGEQLVSLLEQNGIMPTSQRIKIAEILLTHTQHITAEQLMAQLRDADIRISKATVYNTLGLFAEKGVIQPITLDPDRTIFDTNTDPHYHFYNHDTGELRDIEAQLIDIDRHAELPGGTKIEGLDIVIHIKNQQAG